MILLVITKAGETHATFSICDAIILAFLLFFNETTMFAVYSTPVERSETIISEISDFQGTAHISSATHSGLNEYLTRT